MSKPFAVFDIDGTLIRWQLFHALVDGLVKAGLINAKQYEVVREARMAWKRRVHEEAFSKYEGIMVELFDSFLPTIKATELDAVIESVFEEYKDQTYRYTKKLIQDLKKQDYLLFAVSGSPAQIIDKLAAYYGFDDWVGAEYPVENGHFTGKKYIPVGKKHLVLQELVEKHDCNFVGSIAVGDSGGDISMLELAEKPIAFNPDAKLYDVARKNNWRIVVERKNVIYNLDAGSGTYVLA